MLCQNCSISYHATPILFDLPGREFVSRQLDCSECPECHELNICYNEYDTGGALLATNFIKSIPIYPVNYGSRRPSSEIPKEYFDDINEACMILELSPKASAALCRRCLQAIIHNEFKINHGNLGKEIEQVKSEKLLPIQVLRCLDELRKLGNYASHPEFNTNTGEIISVTREEAEWTLNVIELIASMHFAFKNKTDKIIESIERKKA